MVCGKKNVKIVNNAREIFDMTLARSRIIKQSAAAIVSSVNSSVNYYICIC